MKRVLLDTEVLIWWDADDARLGPAARAMIRDAEEVYVSAASAWEIVIKSALGKLRTTRTPSQATADGGFRELPISFEHAEAVGTLPPHHRDPFDRLIIGVATVEAMPIITTDAQFEPYEVKLVDAAV